MKCKEYTKKNTEFEDKSPQPKDCCPEDKNETEAGCCMDTGAEGTGSMMTRMTACCKGAKAFRWCPLIPITLGVIAFLLGYFLSPEVVRILWLIATGIVSIAGILALVLMARVCRS